MVIVAILAALCLAAVWPTRGRGTGEGPGLQKSGPKIEKFH